MKAKDPTPFFLNQENINGEQIPKEKVENF